jgi:hypothetical protein
MSIPTYYISVTVFFDEAIKYGDDDNIDVMLEQKLNYSVQNCVISCSVIY